MTVGENVPIGWRGVIYGTPVTTGDGARVGTVREVLGSDAEDISLTIHPHPTLSETIAFAAEIAAGTITDLMTKRSARR